MKELQKYTPIFFLLLSGVLYSYIGYGIVRADFTQLIAAFGLTFILYWFFVKNYLDQNKWLLLSLILFRLVFVFYTPGLSQDYFRFIWDGRLAFQGMNPYLYLPNNLMQSPDFILPEAQELYEGMGPLSAGHYSNYPPLNQFCFWVAGVLSNESLLGAITVLRVLIVAADVGVLYFGKKLLKHLGLNPNKIYLYLLNPLVILELSGNLHFEGVMLLFLIWSMYLLYQHKWIQGAVVYAMSISVKLLPLLLLPLFYKRLQFKKFVFFSAITIGVNVLLFLPFVSDQLIENYTDTIGLWFTKFEFNASLYYLIRYVGYQFTGYNIIGTVGRFTPFVVIVMVGLFTFLRQNKSISDLFTTMLLVLSCYFILSTTVHPWYIISLVILSVFTTYNYALLWSGLVMLSYYAYSNPDFKENYVLLSIEYGVVILLFMNEILNRKESSKQ